MPEHLNLHGVARMDAWIAACIGDIRDAGSYLLVRYRKMPGQSHCDVSVDDAMH